MRQAREIIRLKFFANVPTLEIAQRLGLAPSTVRETLKRFENAELGWPLPDGMTDCALEAALYANCRSKRGHRLHCEPDWPKIHLELKRKHVTLLILWDEYIAANAGGYSRSRFCELYRTFESKLSPTIQQGGGRSGDTGARATGGRGGARGREDSRQRQGDSYATQPRAKRRGAGTSPRATARPYPRAKGPPRARHSEPRGI
jgi:hypothetical protein